MSSTGRIRTGVVTARVIWRTRGCARSWTVTRIWRVLAMPDPSVSRSARSEREPEAEDYVVIRSSESGRLWGISVDEIGGEEKISVEELEADNERREPIRVPKSN